MIRREIEAGVLSIAYEEAGPPHGHPVVLSRGFPDDPRAWDAVADPLARRGYRVIVPWLRGYGPTRFLSPATPRSGQQAALGFDLLALIDALHVRRCTLAGYDWGGRAACIVAALWPERVQGLVTIGGYNIQAIAEAGKPAEPEQEFRFWYQWYFHTERGRAGLAANRYALCRSMWRLWSPNYRFDEPTYRRTAESFDNPDFVDVVSHSYRHRYGTVPGDPALQPIEARLASRPGITVPAILLHGEAAPPSLSEADAVFLPAHASAALCLKPAIFCHARRHTMCRIRDRAAPECMKRRRQLISTSRQKLERMHERHRRHHRPRNPR